MGIIMLIARHWDSLAIIAAAAAGLAALYRRGGVALLENLLFAFVVEAERQFGGGTGELKKAAVITWVYEKVPKALTLVISRKAIERLLETVLGYAKKKWAANPKLRGYISGDAV